MSVLREIVMPHPVTGEPILRISRTSTGRIEGLPRAESRELLDFLIDHLYIEDQVLTHNWMRGDLLMWDNLSLQHARPSLTGITRRTLQRVCITTHSLTAQMAAFSQPSV
jgi:taurine dioxygenase